MLPLGSGLSHGFEGGSDGVMKAIHVGAAIAGRGGVDKSGDVRPGIHFAILSDQPGHIFPDGLTQTGGSDAHHIGMIL